MSKLLLIVQKLRYSPADLIYLYKNLVQKKDILDKNLKSPSLPCEYFETTIVNRPYILVKIRVNMPKSCVRGFKIISYIKEKSRISP